MLLIQIFSSELTYQNINGALPSSKCSIKAPAKCKTSVYVLLEICLQWSKPLGPWSFVMGEKLFLTIGNENNFGEFFNVQQCKYNQGSVLQGGAGVFFRYCL